MSSKAKPPPGGFFLPVIRKGTRYGIRWKVVSVSGQGIVMHFFRRERENHG